MDRMRPSSSAELPADPGVAIDQTGALRDEVIDTVVVATCAELAAHFHLPEQRLRGSCGTIVRAAVIAVLDQRPPREPPVEEFAGLGREYARTGVPIELTVSAFRAAVRRAWELFEDRRGGSDGQADFERVAWLWGWADATMSRLFVAYRAAEAGLQVQTRRRAFIRRLLFGGLSSPELEEARALFGLSPAGRYRALRARPRPPLAPAELARAIETSFGSSEHEAGMVVGLDRDVAGIVSKPPDVAGDVTIA